MFQAGKQEELERFIALEKEVWEALAAGDMEADAALLTDDFLGVYETGFAGKKDHFEQLRDGPIVASYELTDAKILPVSEDSVLLTYLAIWTRAKATAPADPEKMYVSSLWKNYGGEWKNLFSQDTPAVD